MLGFHIEGLHGSIRGSVQPYWIKHPTDDIKKFSRHAKTVAKLTGNKKTSEVQTFDVYSDGNRSTASESSIHAPAIRDLRYSLRNHMMEEDDAILSIELFLMDSKGTTDGGHEELVHNGQKKAISASAGMASTPYISMTILTGKSRISGSL